MSVEFIKTFFDPRPTFQTHTSLQTKPPPFLPNQLAFCYNTGMTCMCAVWNVALKTASARYGT